MQFARSQLVLAAALAMLAHQSAAQTLPNLDVLDPSTLTDMVSKGGLLKRQAKGTLLKGLNVFGEDVDVPTDPSSLTKKLQKAAQPPTVERREQQGGTYVLGESVPTNPAEITKILEAVTAPQQQKREESGVNLLGDNVKPDGTLLPNAFDTVHNLAMPKQAAKRETGLGLDLDQKPAGQFLMDGVTGVLKQRDFSTNEISPDALSMSKLQPEAVKAVKLAAPIALAPVSPQLKTAGQGYKIAAAVAHEVGADKMVADALANAKDNMPDMPALPGLPKLAKRGEAHRHHARQVRRDAVDATDLSSTDLSMVQGVPEQAVKLAAPIALGKAAGYVGTAQTGVKTAQMVSNMAGVPQMIQKTGAPQMIHDATSEVMAAAPPLPKVPTLPKLPTAGAAPIRRDESMDELTKVGLGLGDSIRDSSLKLSHTATGASNAFTSNIYGERPQKRDMTLPAFSLLPGTGPQAKEGAEELAALLPVPIPGVQQPQKRMEKVAIRSA